MKLYMERRQGDLPERASTTIIGGYQRTRDASQKLHKQT